MLKSKISYHVTDLIPRGGYDVINIGKTYFITFKARTYLSLHAIEDIGESGCGQCYSILHSSVLVIGNNMIRGIMACSNCGAIIVTDFDQEAIRDIRKWLRISDELISQTWQETKTPFLA